MSGHIQPLRALIVGLFVMAANHAAQAGPDAAGVCRNVALTAERILWDQLRKAADENRCRKPWLERASDEFLACAGKDISLKLSRGLHDRWNRVLRRTAAHGAPPGSRALGKDWEKGTIRGELKRTFFGLALASSRSVIEIEKLGGRAKAFVTICKVDQDGTVLGSHRKTFDADESLLASKRIEIENGEATGVLGIVVDAPTGINTLEYRARLRNVPHRSPVGKARGLADLHVHQLANLAFAGRFYWGEHDGPVKTALAPEVLTTKAPAQAGGIRLTLNGMDANILVKNGKSEPDDEGIVTLGGGGHPTYEVWPHHADRSHQQAHIDWLREAVTRGRDEGRNLALLVVSLVNNDVLCKLLKAIDPKGNLPKRGAKGEIVGWRSAAWGCEDDENIKRQLAAAHALERRYPWYRIAMTPGHAREIIADGDLAVVLSLESDKPLSDENGSYGNWLDKLDFYRSRGVTTLQVVHQSDSLFCGAAQHRSMMQVLQALRWPTRAIANLVRTGTTFDVDADGRNRIGLTEEGKRLIHALVSRNMPIDIAHGSVKCRREIMSAVPRGYGLYDSHTKFERLLKPAPGQPDYGRHVLEREKTFLVPEDLEQDYLDHQVLIGLRTASVDVYDAPGGKVANDCPGSATSFAQVVQYAHDRGFTFAYGSDINTGVAQLGPRFGEERCFAARDILSPETRTERPVGSEPNLPERAGRLKPIAGTNYYFDGLATIGWLPELTLDLIELDTPGAESLIHGAERFLKMWERAYP